MDWLQALDTWLFHLVNPALSNSVFDVVMPFCSGNVLFAPAILLACGILVWKGGTRGRICVLLLVAAIALGDGVVCNTLKHILGRVRPCHVITDAHVPDSIGCSDSGSMPSAHASNWFAATVVLLIFYRRSIRFMLPMALLVSFSRVYNGVHYPGDVAAGAIVGIGSASAAAMALQTLWQTISRRLFPLWWQRLPSLLNPVLVPAPTTPDPALADRQWLRLGYLTIATMLLINLVYIGSGIIGLSEDEAYQWTWSKHLALSYYSKPFMIALTQFAGTSLWGDNVFGVRFFAPVLSAIMTLATFRFLARAVNIRAAFWIILLVPTVPLMAVGSVLMTIDPLSVTFWTLAMLAGWRAVQPDSTTRDWAWVGLWMGLGLLSKYTGLFQLLSWVLLFILWQPARIHLRRPGPYVALAVNLLCGLPIVIWNWQHHWITFQHVAESGHLDQPWHFSFSDIHTPEFIATQAGLQNPLFFIPIVWAAFAFWKRRYQQPLLLYFFCMGAPIVIVYFLLSFHSRVLPNWIAPSILPLFCLAIVYWEQRWREGFRPIKYWALNGLALGFLMAVVMRDSAIVAKLIGRPIPPRINVLRRVSGWQETAAAVGVARQKLLTEGKPAFIIGGHYNITGEVSFNLPEARVSVRDNPIVYFITMPRPVNQFFFWPDYLNRKGENAIFVQILEFSKPFPVNHPPLLDSQFESVTDIGVTVVTHKGAVVRYLQMWECRGLR